VTGRNGAGKTSLLRLIAGLLIPAAGQVAVESGTGELTTAEQAHYLGHRDALKSALSVRENLAFWRDFLGGERGDTLPALAAVGLDHIAHLPAAYLSAGQRRRLSMARLLAVRRPVWLLDEPTSALDAAGQTLFARLMDDHLRLGGLIVAATHAPLGIAAARSELVVTGAGRVDWSTLHGSVVAGVAAATLETGRPTVLVAGECLVGRRETMTLGLAGTYAVADSRADPSTFSRRSTSSRSGLTPSSASMRSSPSRASASTARSAPAFSVSKFKTRPMSERMSLPSLRHSDSSCVCSSAQNAYAFSSEDNATRYASIADMSRRGAPKSGASTSKMSSSFTLAAVSPNSATRRSAS